MTQSQVPATMQDMQFASNGLEDMSASDSVLPRIKIVQTEGMWQDNLSQVKRPVLRFIPLGLVKQRVLFHHNVEDGDVPMCKSSDFQIGYPNPDAPRQKSFPWGGTGKGQSGFDPNDFPADAEGNRQLPCASCKLKDWGSSPINDAPYCAEQWTLPIYFDTSMDESGEWAPAILTLQKSSLKPIRSYFTQFAHSQKPPFVQIARATLKTQQRGQVIYSVPTFTGEGESPRERWLEFSEQYTDMRSFLLRPPTRDESEGEAPAQAQDNSYAGPQTVQAEVVQPAPAPAADQQVVQGQVQDPWTGQQAQPQAPVAQTPPPPAAPAPAQPVAQPQAPTPPPAQPAAPAAPAAPSAPTPPPANQGLPF